ncbi:hypothetical protein P9112_003014 [Eukaryota sp. TZLM1-RC]
MSRPRTGSRRSRDQIQHKEYDAFVKVLDAFHSQGDWSTEKVSLVQIVADYLNIPPEVSRVEIANLTGDEDLITLSLSSPAPRTRESAPKRSSQPKTKKTPPPASQAPTQQFAPSIVPRFISPISEGAIHALIRMLRQESLTPQEQLYVTDAIQKELEVARVEALKLDTDPVLLSNDGIRSRINEAKQDLTLMG